MPYSPKQSHVNTEKKKLWFRKKTYHDERYQLVQNFTVNLVIKSNVCIIATSFRSFFNFVKLQPTTAVLVLAVYSIKLPTQNIVFKTVPMGRYGRCRRRLGVGASRGSGRPTRHLRPPGPSGSTQRQITIRDSRTSGPTKPTLALTALARRAGILPRLWNPSPATLRPPATRLTPQTTSKHEIQQWRSFCSSIFSGPTSPFTRTGDGGSVILSTHHTSSLPVLTTVTTPTPLHPHPHTHIHTQPQQQQ